MSNELVKFELQENDLQLVVSEKTLGSLTTNARQIKDLVEKALPNYDISNYNESNIDLAKKDKAMLNNAGKALNAKRLEFEKEFMKPFEEFKGVVSDTVKLISDCSGKIDAVVKQSEQNAKNERREKIESLWATNNFTLVLLSKVFNEKWLNKGTKEKDIAADIETIIAKIKDDIITIEAIGEDTELLKSLYLDTLNLNSTIQYANKLKDNKERARKEAEAREAEKARRAEETTAQPVTPVAPTTPSEPPKRIPEPIQCAPAPEPQIHVRAFKVSGTREQIIALGNFMNANNIQFEKIELT